MSAFVDVDLQAGTIAKSVFPAIDADIPGEDENDHHDQDYPEYTIGPYPQPLLCGQVGTVPSRRTIRIISRMVPSIWVLQTRDVSTLLQSYPLNQHSCCAGAKQAGHPNPLSVVARSVYPAKTPPRSCQAADLAINQSTPCNHGFHSSTTRRLRRPVS